MGVRANPVLSFVRGGRSSQSEHGPADDKAGSLPYSISDENLLRLFTEKGYRPVSARVITDRPGPRKQCALDEVRSNLTALHFIHQEVARANAKGHDGEGWVLAGIGSETRSVHHEKIPYVMGLLKLIEHGLLRVVAHPYCSRLVQRPPRR